MKALVEQRSFQLRVAEALVDGLSADLKVTGKERLISSAALSGISAFSARCRAALLGEGDAFPLAFSIENTAKAL